MPQLYPDAPELAVSPEGTWAAELSGTSLRLYDLGRGSARQAALAPAAPPSDVPLRLSPLAELDRPAHPGRIVFVSEDRLLHLWQVAAEGEGEAHIAAELLAVPTLNEAGRGLRVPGCTRILGLGPSGAVVAPSGPGADIISPRGNELLLHRTFIRGEVIAAVAAPDRRFLMEQRSGFELWDPQARKGLGRLVLNTRQVAAYLGFALAGRVLWAVTGTIPVHVDVFRASDGRRLFELDQPGRALQADAATGRLVVFVEERGSNMLLDLDLAARALRRVALPTGGPRPRSFVINPAAGTSEALVLVESDEAPLMRLALPKLAGRAAPLPVGDRATAARLKSGRPGEPAPVGDKSTRALRQGRPETRLIRRPTAAAGHDGDDATDEVRPALSARSGGRSLASPPPEDADDADYLDESGAEATEPAAEVVDLAVASDLSEELGGEAEAASHRQREMLGRVFDPGKSAAAWQWELARWAQAVLLGTSSSVLPLPPEGGPLASLGQRLRLSAVAQKALGFLYAAQSLLGARPYGMRPIELAQCLGPLHDEPLVLAELLASAPLRTLDLVGLRPDGRLQLRLEVATYLSGAPCPELISSATSSIGREPLPPGLYLVPGLYPHRPQLPSGQPLLRIDALRERRPAAALLRALRRAQLYDAVVIIDGIAGLSFPAFTADGTLPLLRSRLLTPRVPILLCAMPDAPASMGLQTRNLPAAVLQALRGGGDQSAPLLPSAPLPIGASWRAPTLPTNAAVVPGPNPTGIIEHVMNGDRRAAVIIGASATPEAYASAAYLAARDGALLLLDAELTNVRALVLGMLLSQLPVWVAAYPPGGPEDPWPPSLQPFALATSEGP